MFTKVFYVLCIYICSNSFARCENLPESCDSPVYCYGDLLYTVQVARVFDDGKTFVDLKQIHKQNETLNNFKLFKEQVGGIPTKRQVKQFVGENFELGDELANSTLVDFNPSPEFVTEICNITVRNFTLELMAVWPMLARKIKQEVVENIEQYSIIPVPNTFIIPGGRFREYYYWDSYWIIDGLLISGMNETVKGMLDNFLSVVDRIGFIPNGGRIYYLQRSQPPLLTPMANRYFQQTQDIAWLKKSIGTLSKELNYWTKQTVKVKKGGNTYTLLHYNSPSLGPRPESYREDLETAAVFTDSDKRQEVYTDLKSGAESGWDFSGRWIFDKNGGNNANLSSIETRRVVPVDLNAFLCGAFRDISFLYLRLGQLSKATQWKMKQEALMKAINAVLWNDEDKIWYDYDLKLARHRKRFYPSSVTPLWSRCFDENRSQELAEDVLSFLKFSKVLDYLGGIPTSVDHTGEQWDFPNAWPPLQDLVVRGLSNTNYEPAKEEAKILAKRWVNSNVLGFHENGMMFEKYDAVVPGQRGDGGEYPVQSGFGWSNGVVLRFIYDYYRK